jgi:hypothetical protein
MLPDDPPEWANLGYPNREVALERMARFDLQVPPEGLATVENFPQTRQEARQQGYKGWLDPTGTWIRMVGPVDEVLGWDGWQPYDPPEGR